MTNKLLKILSFLAAWLLTVPCLGASRWYNATDLVGGSTGALDTIDGQNLSDGDKCIVITASGETYFYNLDSDSALSEDSTNYRVVSPDSNADNKRWILIWSGGRAIIQDSTIDQGDASVAGTLAWHIDDLAGTPAEITVLPGTYTVSTSDTVPSTVTLKFIQGGILAIATTKTLTVNGSVDAGRYQIFSLAGTGAVEGLSFAYPVWFGAAADVSTPTDDSDEFIAAFASVAAKGGEVIVDQKSQYYINADVALPVSTGLRSNSESNALREINYSSWSLEDQGAVIYLNPSYSLQMNEGCYIKGITIIAYGVTYPSDATEVATWTGNAIELLDHSHGATIKACNIVGFNFAITNWKGGTAHDTDYYWWSEKIRITDVNFDCINGILIGNSSDTSYITNVHGGPIAGKDSGFTDADHKRSGVAFYFDTGIDGIRVTNCAAYGYLETFKVYDVDQIEILGSSSDYPTTSTETNYGINIVGVSTFVKVIGFNVWGPTDYPIAVNFTAGSAQEDTVIISGSMLTGTNHGVFISDGNAIITGNLIRGGTSGIYLGENADQVSVHGNQFINSTYAINAHASFEKKNLIYGHNYTENLGTSVMNNWGVPSFAADDATPDVSNQKIWKTGDDDALTITDFDGDIYEGKELIIIGADGGATTIQHNASYINLRGGGNVTLSDGETMHLIYDGTDWDEISNGS